MCSIEATVAYATMPPPPLVKPHAHVSLMAEIRRLMERRVPAVNVVALLRCTWREVNEAVEPSR